MQKNDLKSLPPGRLLNNEDVQSMFGCIPPQREFTVEVHDSSGYSRKGFRRHTVQGKDAWEVTY